MRSGAQREKRVAPSPDGFHRQGLALEDDLSTLLVLPALEVACHIHPADGLLAGLLVGLTDDEIDVNRLTDPIIQVAVVLYVEDFPTVFPARSQVGIAALELYVDLLPARMAIIVLELDFAVDAIIKLSQRSENRFASPVIA